MAKDEKVSAEEIVRGIRRQTRPKYSTEEKISIALGGFRGEESIAELCRVFRNRFRKYQIELLDTPYLGVYTPHKSVYYYVL